jgi:hypothetical protein
MHVYVLFFIRVYYYICNVYIYVHMYVYVLYMDLQLHKLYFPWRDTEGNNNESAYIITQQFDTLPVHNAWQCCAFLIKTRQLGVIML